MIGAGSQFHARALVLTLAVEVVRAYTENNVAVLPAQDRTGSSGRSQDPTPFIGRHLLIGLAAQFLEGCKNRAEDDFKRNGALIADLNILRNRRQKPRECHLHGIKTSRQRSGGEPPAIIREQLKRDVADDLVGSNHYGGAHLWSSR